MMTEAVSFKHVLFRLSQGNDIALEEVRNWKQSESIAVHGLLFQAIVEERIHIVPELDEDEETEFLLQHLEECVREDPSYDPDSSPDEAMAFLLKYLKDEWIRDDSPIPLGTSPDKAMPILLKYLKRKGVPLDPSCPQKVCPSDDSRESMDNALRSRSIALTDFKGWMLEDLRSALYSRYEALRYVTNWMCYELANSPDRRTAGILKKWLERIYVSGCEKIQGAVIAGATEHIFEDDAGVEFFEDWSTSPIFAEAYKESLICGDSLRKSRENTEKNRNSDSG